MTNDDLINRIQSSEHNLVDRDDVNELIKRFNELMVRFNDLQQENYQYAVMADEAN